MKTNTSHHKVTWILGTMLAIGIALSVVLTIGSMFFLRGTILDSGIPEKIEQKKYDKHYVLITDDFTDPLWESVYQGASKEGEGEAYLEYLGCNLPVSYTVPQLLRIAIDAKVDGIIVVGDESEETVALINEAVGTKIPVVTVLSDCSSSLRQCFVGINSYSLGERYGEQALQLLDKDKTQKVYVLIDNGTNETSKNSTYLGIKDKIEKGKSPSTKVEMQAIAIDNKRAFTSEETIRDIVIDKANLPDILICLSAVDTRCAYQAVVDYNKVGDVEILGYYDSEKILNAIDKSIIHSTITLDGTQMGALCMSALKEYNDTGHVSAYFPVDTKVINSYNVTNYEEQKNKTVINK